MNALQTIINQLSERVGTHFAQSKRRSIVKSALKAIENRHPDWAGISFDEHFVDHQGAAVLADYFQSGQLPDVAAIVEAWSNQFNWQSATKLCAQERFMPVAEDFVYILSTESYQPKSLAAQPQRVESVRYRAAHQHQFGLVDTR